MCCRACWRLALANCTSGSRAARKIPRKNKPRPWQKRRRKPPDPASRPTPTCFIPKPRRCSRENRKLKQKMEALQSRAALQSKPSRLPQARDADDVIALPAARIWLPKTSSTASPRANMRVARQPQAAAAAEGQARHAGLRSGRQRAHPVRPGRAAFRARNRLRRRLSAAGPQFRFRISGIDYREALHDLEAMTNSFVVPLSVRLFMVAQDTPQKRNDLEQTIVLIDPGSIGAHHAGID